MLWGTDSIWYGTPQWQIEAFRRFEIPKALIEKPRLRAAHACRSRSRSSASTPRALFNVDVNAKRNEIPEDYLSQIKMTYLDEGPSPSNRFYGWVTG